MKDASTEAMINGKPPMSARQRTLPAAVTGRTIASCRKALARPSNRH